MKLNCTIIVQAIICSYFCILTFKLYALNVFLSDGLSAVKKEVIDFTEEEVPTVKKEPLSLEELLSKKKAEEAARSKVGFNVVLHQIIIYGNFY